MDFLVSNKKDDLQKKHFIEKKMKKILNYILYTRAIWVDEITGVMISLKKINKN